MHYIVLDLEWNQPYTPKAAVKRPAHLRGEIIQIGAVKLDRQLHQLDTFKMLVKPKYYRRMHKRVSRLTRITDEDLQYGFPFRQAIAFFRAWCSPQSVFLTWGDNDAEILRAELAVYALSAAWLPEIYDIQRIFGRQVAKERRQYSLPHALALIGESAYPTHDALYDAINAARVLPHLDLERGIAEYKESQKEEFREMQEREPLEGDTEAPAEGWESSGTVLLPANFIRTV